MQFGATVVLTSTWCQLAVMPWPWRRNKPRDDKVLAIILFIIGAILARFILVAAGSAVTIAIGTGYVQNCTPWLISCEGLTLMVGPD